MRTHHQISIVLIFILLSFVNPGLLAQDKGTHHLLGSDHTTVVPDTFLRGYDPITVFFASDRGPAEGGSIDQPGDLFRISPAHPGEYRWVDARTLQFLPTTSWPALQRFSLSIDGKQFALVTLMSPPKHMTPANGSKNLEPITDINLSFLHPIGVKKLASMLTFEVKPLPGVGEGDGYGLSGKDFVIKEMERTSIKNPAQYQLTFTKPIPYGTSTTMHLRLSLDSHIPGSLARYTFSTKPLFSLMGVGSGSTMFPIATRGSVYSKEQALDCGSGASPLFLKFSDVLGTVSLNQIKQMVRFIPSVKNLRIEVSANKVLLFFDAKRDQAYQLELCHVPIKNASGRDLNAFGETSLTFFYRRAVPYLKWLSSQGILERYGPQVFPMQGRGAEQVDLRLYKIDPLNRNFWPFSSDPVAVDESKRPRGPGEEPAYATAMVEQIKLLGSPLVSTIVPLPMKTGSGQMKFGINLKKHLVRISGNEEPGHYLVGYRPIGIGSARYYVRIQVTDLSLSTVEEESAVTFVVTSLKTGRPVPGALVRVDGRRKGKWEPVISGTTDASGKFKYEHTRRIKHQLTRIFVRHDNDALVLDPNNPPPHFMDNHWFGSYSTWLGWLNREPRETKKDAVHKAHILTERPVYRPEEPVHIKGYVRLRQQGKIKLDSPNRKRSVIVEGPGGKRWTYPVTLTPAGSFYLKFIEKDLPTGFYRAIIQDDKENLYLADVDFKKEAYRIPRFEIKISGPDKVALDQPFKLTMTADYYAGGRVVGQETTWHVTQFPYRHRLHNYPDFLFSSDERFSSGHPFRSTGSRVKKDVTDENGSSVLEIDPTQEEDARPRRYVAEVTVRGADEQTVTSTKSVLALPPFILGLKLPRFLKAVTSLKPEILVVGTDDKPMAGKEFHLRLLQRQWHSYLRESDFTTGKAKYVTDVVDQLIFENDYVSEAGPQTIPLSIEESGVYIVEISARDKLGRLQKVQADLYVAGKTPIAWKKPKANVFETTMDKKSYIPGDTAVLVMKSPFQEGHALVIVEGPTANTYHWVNVTAGQGLFSLPITGDMTPQVPVHVLLMRGRLTGTDGALEKGQEDRGKPVAMANTTWIKVKPRDNELNIELDFPKKNLPGATITMKIRMATPDNAPLSGEVTLWLVDRAVLALGKEKRLDPLPSFIDPVRALIRIRETRNEVVGNLSVEEIAGGGAGEAEEGALFGRVTVRRRFESVPYYNPAIQVTDGYAEVTITLPDNLTEFAVRAVATNGLDRFGAAKSKLAIRLPLIVQSALPRFVRPGDSFLAGGIGRIVEGEGGPGNVELQVKGLDVHGDKRQTITWVKDRPEKLYFPMEVPSDAVETEDAQVTVRMAVKRDTDGAMDAFEVTLPIRKDKQIRRVEKFVRLEPGKTLQFPSAGDEVRPGTMSQAALITSQPALIKMLAGLDYLARYEHGCTEQRVSKVLPELALKDILSIIGQEDRSHASEQMMKETFTYLESTLQPDGLYSCWPGSDGYVGLTAYVVEFLLSARQEGYNFKPELLDRGVAALKESLRSDYSRLIEGYSFVERAEALAALAKAGEFDEAYAHDLLARALSMDLYSEAKIMVAFQEEDSEYLKEINRLKEDLMKSLVFQLRDGKEVYQGLQYRAESWGGLILSSETKTLANVTRSLYRANPESDRVKLLIDELINLGKGDGWGSTNANAAAMLALGEVLKTPDPEERGTQIQLSFGQDTQTVDTTGKVVSRVASSNAAPGTLRLIDNGSGDSPLAWLSLEYVPAGPGDKVKQKNNGFVVERIIQFIPSDDQPPIKHKVMAGQKLELDMGAIVEEHIQVINAEDRHYVAIQAPFAAGFEPLNPNLATSPPEAKPAGRFTMEPSYSQYEDDKVTFYFDTLPKGTYDFYFRLRSGIAGSFTHPPAKAEMMYKLSVYGNSDGTRIVISARDE